MPDNASLYDDDSDHESVRNELSPTDGYFNERHTQPQDVLVPDPSQSNSSNDKEREAREQLAASRAETSHTQAPESSRQQHISQSPVHSPLASPTQAIWVDPRHSSLIEIPKIWEENNRCWEGTPAEDHGVNVLVIGYKRNRTRL